jgi:hypothetical protein
MGSIKDHLKFALKVLVALVIINFILDIIGGTFANYIAHPAQALGLSKGTSA